MIENNHTDQIMDNSDDVTISKYEDYLEGMAALVQGEPLTAESLKAYTVSTYQVTADNFFKINYANKSIPKFDRLCTKLFMKQTMKNLNYSYDTFQICVKRLQAISVRTVAQLDYVLSYWKPEIQDMIKKVQNECFVNFYLLPIHALPYCILKMESDDFNDMAIFVATQFSGQPMTHFDNSDVEKTLISDVDVRALTAKILA
ncbi:hypothetical protein [Weissella minor]|nr:hypothetical protein [Weissella minor]